MGTLLAQTAQTTTVLVWVGVLIGVVLLGGAAAWAVRRALLAKDESQSAMGLLESMRAMRDEGRMSAEEYDAARRAIARKAADEDKRGAGTSEAPGATAPTPAPRGTPAPNLRPGPHPGGQRGGSQGGAPGGAGGPGGGAGRRPGGGPSAPGGGGGPASRG